MTKVENANCSMCRKAPLKGGDKSCPIKELFGKRSLLESHDCFAFVPFSERQLQTRAPKPVQDSLF